MSILDPKSVTEARHDQATADAINGTGPTRAALNDTYPTKLTSPRDTARVKQERKPVLLVDQIAPNANYSHKIVWAEGDTLWSYGMDFSLRKSTDKGVTWGAPLSNSTAANMWAKYEMFFKTSAGTFITTSHPSDNSAPKIIRSVDGVTWTDVVPAKANVDYLGVTNICQDPVTGYLYLAEYVTVQSTLLPAPTPGTPTTATTGGTLAAATHYYVLTATNANGETLKSAEVSITTTGTTSTVTIPWTAVSGATGYKVYRGTATGAHSLLATLGNVTTYTDTGAATTATNPPTTNTTGLTTWSILRSTDDGATWTTFHTFQRDAEAFPTTAVRHGHSVQWDQFSQRIYFLTGDSEQAAGIYRVDSAGTGIEKVVLNSETTGGNLATAVGIMFFPNYIAWGMDQTSDSYLLRMNRNQIGVATTASVEKIGRVQSTAWYTCRVASDGTEWLMAVSNETSVGRVDAAVHIYRVADDAATMDEVLTIPTPNDSTFSRAHPIGGPLQTGAPAGVVWLGTNVTMPLTAKGTLFRGQQFSAILGWGGQALQQVSTNRAPYFAATSQSSGNVSLAASEQQFFGVTEAPTGATRLYILEAGVTAFSGTGLPYLRVFNQTTGLVLKMEDNATDMQFQNRSYRAAKNQAGAPYVVRSAIVSPGTQIRFRIDEVVAATVVGCAYVTYAWGF